MDIMFNGIPVDCTSTDFNSKAICSVFESGDVKQIQPTDKPGMLKFSLFGGVKHMNTFFFLNSMLNDHCLIRAMLRMAIALKPIVE